MTPIPIIRLEIEGMKHAVVKAMSAHIMQLDADIKRTIEDVCTPENIMAIIEKTASSEIESAIESEVQRFYRYGAGRSAIRDAVERALEDKQ